MNLKLNPENVLLIIFIIYLVLGMRMPSMVAEAIDSLAGKIVLLLMVIYLFVNTNPLLAILSVWVAYDLMRRSTSFSEYAPSEANKMLNPYNRYPYTLEQEMVKKMAPMVNSVSSFDKPSYKPTMDDLRDAATL
jgi:hypothetical protein